MRERYKGQNYRNEDEKDYKKRGEKFVTDNVVFKEMDVNIDIKESN